MTSNAAIYISFLLNMLKSKKIGLIWDKNTSHYSNKVLQFIKKCNEEATSLEKIVLELVDEGLTPIIQVTDVAVNKITVSREQLLDFVLDTINEINQDNND